MSLDTIRAFLDRNRDQKPVSESFPLDAVRALAEAKSSPEGAAELLLPLLDLATNYDDATDKRGRNCYEGDDLRRQAAVVDALAGCPGEAVETRLTSLLTSQIHHKYHAAPGSPDADKYDRDTAVERSQDVLAQACVQALAKIGARSQPALVAVAAAARHRNPDVRRAAWRALPDASTTPGEIDQR